MHTSLGEKDAPGAHCYSEQAALVIHVCVIEIPTILGMFIAVVVPAKVAGASISRRHLNDAIRLL